MLVRRPNFGQNVGIFCGTQSSDIQRLVCFKVAESNDRESCISLNGRALAATQFHYFT